MPNACTTTAKLNLSNSVVAHAVSELIEELGPRATGQLLTLFMAHVSETLEQIRQVDDCIELAELGRIAHVMKGTAGCYGANQLSEMSCRLNKACQSNDHRAATALLGPFMTQCERTITLYKEIARICQTLH
jgi:HPt (histidine-containing phosphotransfer) domain-containing protein